MNEEQSSLPLSTPVVPTPLESHSSQNKWKVLAIIFFLLSSIGIPLTYILGKIPSNQTTFINNTDVSSPEQMDVSPTVAKTLTADIEWRVSTSISPIQFEYPNGWHVSSVTPDSYENGVEVRINSEPNMYVPTDGPVSDIMMNWKNGSPDLSTTFESEKEQIKKNLENLQEEIIKTELTDIYHYTGTTPVGGYMGGSQIDRYIFFVDSESNPMNDTIVTLYTINNPEKKDILRHIATSFRKP
jgi:hypothetical protein